uniref:Secreted protein n=1 Tax=Macrostomum lignano TaxID=282301 RepID=A0A1I8FJN9_9PLAT
MGGNLVCQRLRRLLSAVANATPFAFGQPTRSAPPPSGPACALVEGDPVCATRRPRRLVLPGQSAH